METQKPNLKEYADGWITEGEGMAVPPLLKFAYIVIAAGAFTYFLVHMYGAVDHSDRGSLVRAMNAATEASGGLMYAIAAMIVIFGMIVVALSFGKSQD
jgi:hypothetical protein